MTLRSCPYSALSVGTKLGVCTPEQLDAASPAKGWAGLSKDADFWGSAGPLGGSGPLGVGQPWVRTLLCLHLAVGPRHSILPLRTRACMGWSKGTAFPDTREHNAANRRSTELPTSAASPPATWASGHGSWGTLGSPHLSLFWEPRPLHPLWVQMVQMADRALNRGQRGAGHEPGVGPAEV